jgi:hypothetical protein
LHHKVSNHTVEQRSIVETFARQNTKLFTVAGFVGKQAGDVAFVGRMAV